MLMSRLESSRRKKERAGRRKKLSMEFIQGIIQVIEQHEEESRAARVFSDLKSDTATVYAHVETRE
jgi:F0F1-type ATP synthase assembly protein I